MNEEHYRKVLKVMALTVAPYRERVKEFAKASNAKGSSALTPSTQEFTKCLLLATASDTFWEQEFPTAQGYGTAKHIDLSGADLRGGTFASSLKMGCLDGADFTGANLEGSRWLFIHARHADFRNANLRNSIMMMFCCEGAKFWGADLSGANLVCLVAGGDNQKEPLDFSGANLTDARMELHFRIRFDFTGANLQGFRVPPLAPSTPLEAETQRKAREMFFESLTAEQRAQIVTEADPAPASSGCFIATACYESGDSPEVRDLRRYRDDVLLATWTGRLLVRLYHRLSPAIAGLLHSNPLLKTVVRVAILDQVVRVVRKRRKNAAPR